MRSLLGSVGTSALFLNQLTKFAGPNGGSRNSRIKSSLTDNARSHFPCGYLHQKDARCMALLLLWVRARHARSTLEEVSAASSLRPLFRETHTGRTTMSHRLCWATSIQRVHLFTSLMTPLSI